jgi:hypothetical protein
VFIGGRLGRRRPEGIIMLALVLAAGGCLGAAVTYTRLTSLVAALLATMAGSMGKLALDAVVQRDIPEATRNSAFARSETALQLTWVVGGAFGLIEMSGTVGFAVAAAVVCATLFIQAGALRRSRLAARDRLGGADLPPDGAVATSAPVGAVPSTFGQPTFDQPGMGPPGPTYPAGAGGYPPGAPPQAPQPDPAAMVSAPVPSVAPWRDAPAPIPATLEDPTRPDAPRQRRGLGRRRRA